jgi:hypothetical protein
MTREDNNQGYSSGLPGRGGDTGYGQALQAWVADVLAHIHDVVLRHLGLFPRTLVVAGDGGVMRRYLDEGIAVATITDPLVLLRGKL